MSTRCVPVRAYDTVGQVRGGIAGQSAYRVAENEDDTMLELIDTWDDGDGNILGSRMVTKARMKELGYIQEKQVWDRMTRKEALRRHIKIVGTSWLDVNKGDSEPFRGTGNSEHLCGAHR